MTRWGPELHSPGVVLLYVLGWPSNPFGLCRWHGAKRFSIQFLHLMFSSAAYAFSLTITPRPQQSMDALWTFKVSAVVGFDLQDGTNSEGKATPLGSSSVG